MEGAGTASESKKEKTKDENKKDGEENSNKAAWLWGAIRRKTSDFFGFSVVKLIALCYVCIMMAFVMLVELVWDINRNHPDADVHWDMFRQDLMHDGLREGTVYYNGWFVFLKALHMIYTLVLLFIIPAAYFNFSYGEVATGCLNRLEKVALSMTGGDSKAKGKSKSKRQAVQKRRRYQESDTDSKSESDHDENHDYTDSEDDEGHASSRSQGRPEETKPMLSSSRRSSVGSGRRQRETVNSGRITPSNDYEDDYQ